MISRLLTFLCLLLFSTGSFAANQYPISYTDIGQGTPIVLIHAFPTDQRLWKPQQDELKKNFRVITLDLRGFGQASPTDGNAVTMAEYADDIKTLLGKLHISKAIIGGESMGGYIALAFLQKYPDSIAGLILSNTQAIDDSPEMKEKREASARDVLEHGSSNLINNFMSKALSQNASDETKAYLRNIVETQPATAIASALRGMALRDDTSYLLSKTGIPILIITGKLDVLISPDQSLDMHLLSKNSKLVVIPNAGHLSNLEQPAQWNQAVMDMFLEKNNEVLYHCPFVNDIHFKKPHGQYYADTNYNNRPFAWEEDAFGGIEQNINKFSHADGWCQSGTCKVYCNYILADGNHMRLEHLVFDENIITRLSGKNWKNNICDENSAEKCEFFVSYR